MEFALASKEKERVESKEITAATLNNFIKSLKVFCDEFSDFA
jgi:hypothetical protein